MSHKSLCRKGEWVLLRSLRCVLRLLTLPSVRVLMLRYGLSVAHMIVSVTGEGVKAANSLHGQFEKRSRRRRPVSRTFSGAGGHLNPPLVNGSHAIPKHKPAFRTQRRHALHQWLTGAVERRDYALGLLFELSGIGPLKVHKPHVLTMLCAVCNATCWVCVCSLVSPAFRV